MADKNPNRIVESLIEEKEEKVEEQPNEPETGADKGESRSFDEMVDALAKDEEQAIAEYDRSIAELGDDPVVEQLKKIRAEEESHLNFLREVKENHDLKYVDTSDEKPEDAKE